jgi:hypothetical protein
MSASTQRSLRAALRRQSHRSRWFWRNGTIRVSSSCIADLRIVASALTVDEWATTWTPPIALMLPRTATHIYKSDASYGGIGGWSPHTQLWVWGDLLRLSFSMKRITPFAEPADPRSPDGLHINILEFLGIIINLWLALILLRKSIPPPTGFILELVSDNTSGLSWLTHAACTDNPSVRALARLVSCLLLHCACHLPRVQSSHIAGPLNIKADYLSRLVPGLVPSWESVTSECSQLATCRICLLPPELLLMLADLCSATKIAAPFEAITMRL